MQLTIDTKHDSKEEIRKAIGMLTSLLGETENQAKQKNIFEEPETEMTGMLNLFEPAKKEKPEMQFY